GLVLHMLAGVAPPAIDVLATDLTGQVVWYYDPPASDPGAVFATSLAPGGTLLLMSDRSPVDTAIGGYDRPRGGDLARNPLRQTTGWAVSAERAPLGQPPIDGFHHDAQRLPNGDTAVLAHVHETINDTLYAGDMVIVLDQDFHVAWTWNGFDFLDVNRTLENPSDWLHANAVAWS